jgi:hypothetical protein
VGFPRPPTGDSVGELRFPIRRTGGGATHPLLLSCTGLGVTWLFSVGLRPTGLLFDEANTESTASLWGVETRRETGALTAKYTPVGHLPLPIRAFAKRAALYPTTEVVGLSASTQSVAGIPARYTELRR